MPHHSRLAGFMIDCGEGTLADAAGFWSRALDLPVTDPDEGGRGRYAVLGGAPGGLHVEVQKVEHASRVHLDIEADDIHAEASRLEALGARRIELVRDRWWLMEAPTGHRFCVVPMRDPERRAAPSAWE
ncbi:VOC family protein [Luteimonas viscosa]|uniref:VOC family protein n=1 Tax=Luteimonas viscosa TaxID=1132694 RepID=A0A5D4XSX3_9GAMM|nr:VOC family protein [Luteimonas viscosa]TYT27073.1 VOC family protein [Luteimonas viscosa]